MAILRCVPGAALEVYRRRLASARALLVSQIPATLTSLGDNCAQALGEAAPKGTEGGGTNPPGDAAGPLASSFVSTVETGDGSGTVIVRTTQPTKLGYVVNGTGIYGPQGTPIRPRYKKALYWPKAPHPMRQVRGQQPNDFVSPVIEEYQAEANDRMDELAIQVADMLNGGAL